MADAPEWVASINDEALKGTLSQFESQDKFFETIGYKPEVKEVDWRGQIKDEEAKKFAENSADVNHLIGRALDMRKQLSTAVVKPGKDADEKQIAAYRKAMDIPNDPNEYEFPQVKGQELTDEIKNSRASWAKRFHEANVPKSTAKALIDSLNQDVLAAEEAQTKADKAFAEAEEAKLKQEWKGDYDKNKTLANRAFKDISERAGIKLDDLTQIETKDGRFLMDRSEIVRLFAIIGREMSEGSLGPTLTDSEKETIDDQIKDMRKKQDEASRSGNSKEANRLYQQEQALIARRDGDRPIVGVGRAA